MGERRAEQGHDAVAHDLVHRALVAVDGLHHPLQYGIEQLARLFGIAIGEQLHRALEVGEEDGDLLALALEGGLRGQDLLGQVLGRVGLGRRGTWSLRCPGSATLRTRRRTSEPEDSTLHRSGRRLPAGRQHSPQNFWPAVFSWWHREHSMVCLARLRLQRPPSLAHLGYEARLGRARPAVRITLAVSNPRRAHASQRAKRSDRGREARSALGSGWRRRPCPERPGSSGSA